MPVVDRITFVCIRIARRRHLCSRKSCQDINPIPPSTIISMIARFTSQSAVQPVREVQGPLYAPIRSKPALQNAEME